MTQEQQNECKNKGKDPKVVHLTLFFVGFNYLILEHWDDKVTSVFFKSIDSWSVKTMSGFCIRWKMAGCMCVELMLLILSVITWWDKIQGSSIRTHVAIESKDVCKLHSVFVWAVIQGWRADSWEETRRWKGEMSLWSFSETRLHHGW